MLELFDCFVQLLLQCYLFGEERTLEVHNLVDEILAQKQQRVRSGGLQHHDLFISDFKFQNSSLNTLRIFLRGRLAVPGLSQDALREMAQPSLDDLSKLYSLEIAPQTSVL